MKTELIMGLTAIVSGGASGFFTWFFSMKRHKSDVRSKEEETNAIEIANEIKIADYYKVMLDDLGSRYESKFQEFVQIHNKKIQILEDEIKLLKRKIWTLTQENKELKKQLNERYSSNP